MLLPYYFILFGFCISVFRDGKGKIILVKKHKEILQLKSEKKTSLLTLGLNRKIDLESNTCINRLLRPRFYAPDETCETSKHTIKLNYGGLNRDLCNRVYITWVCARKIGLLL
ncbi:hypothetical protein ACFOG5_16385 [Pedobacter fastidiosus]|uniref:hypothetical protein n=1 Tax=Pedobacter fastidiosus TaxID=2765361 RepID=UPI00360E44A1